MTYTPSPWVVGNWVTNDHEPQHYEIKANGHAGDMKARIAKAYYGQTQAENLANARLIAAAPQLLEALQFLAADYMAIEGPKLTMSHVPIRKARAAIKAAEGE
tara:strand:+ start:3941 stop:4249 length:309 start_codon:yes stop_codon:yes gene_type:complete